MKFRNIIYSVGDDVALDYPGEEYGKILVIIRVKKELMDFPLLKVAWYYSKDNSGIAAADKAYLCKKDLVLTDHTDWQYM